MKKKMVTGLISCLIVIATLVGCGSKAPAPAATIENESKQEAGIDETNINENPGSDTEENTKPVEPDGKRVRLLDMGYQEYCTWEYGNARLNVTYQVPVLAEEEAKRFPELQKTFTDLRTENETLAEETLQSLKEYLVEMESYGDAMYGEYYDKTKISILRADTNAVGLLMLFDGYSGGAHGYYGYIGNAFDTKTGKKLELKDVVTDISTFFDKVLERLKEQYSDIYEDFWDPEGYIEELKKEPNISWSLSNEGVTVYFNPYEISSYADGVQFVTVYFDEIPDIFNPKYTETADEYVIPIVNGQPVSIRMNGTRENLIVETISHWDEEYDYVSYYEYIISLGDKSLTLTGYGFDRSAMVVYSKGKYYLYFIEQTTDSMSVIYIVDLATMTYDENATVYGIIGDSELYVERTSDGGNYLKEIRPFINPSSFIINSNMDILGTYSGKKVYYVDENGIPVSNDERYVIDAENALKTKRAIDVDVIDETGKVIDKETLGEDTYLMIVFTNSEDYVDVQIVDESMVAVSGDEYYQFYQIDSSIKYDREKKTYRIHFDDKDWIRTINGVSVEDIFVGIVYAG